MSRFQVDGRFYSHPKVLATPSAARGLWVSAGAWSADQEKSGFVPDHALAFLGGTPELAGELVAAGLWQRSRGGYQFHDWSDWQPDLAKAKEGMSDGGNLGNHRRWHEKRGKVDPDCAFCSPIGSPSGTRSAPDSGSESAPESRASDFDFDFDQSKFLESSQDLDAREDRRISDRSLIGHLTAVGAQLTGHIVTERQTLRAVAEIRARADRSATPVKDFRAYAEAVLRREKNLPALLGEDPAAAGLHLAAPLPPDAHPYEPDPTFGVEACAVCGLQRSNLKHREAS